MRAEIASFAVVTKAGGKLAARLQHKRGEFATDTILGHAIAGAGAGERTDDGAGVIANRHRHRVHVFEELPGVDRIAVAGNALELFEQRRAIDDRIGGIAVELLGQTRPELFLRIEGEMRLADGRTMQREHLADGRSDADSAVLRFRRLEQHDPFAACDGDEGALAAFVGDFGKDRTRLAYQPHVMDIAAAEMQAFDAEAIIFAGAILLDIAARFEGGEDAEDVVLVQLEAFGKFGDTEFVALAKELFEDVERMRHGLDNVVCLVAPHHWVYFPGSRRSAVVTDPQFWKTVLL